MLPDYGSQCIYKVLVGQENIVSPIMHWVIPVNLLNCLTLDGFYLCLFLFIN